MATQPEAETSNDPMAAFIEADAAEDVGLSDADFEALMGGSAPQEAPQEPEPEAVPDSPNPAPAGAPEAPSKSPVEGPPASSEADALRQQVIALTAQMAELQAKYSQPQAEPAASAPATNPPSPEEPAVPQYLYGIPKPILDALESDSQEQRGVAMTHLLSQIAQRVHVTIRKEMQDHVNTRLQGFTQQMTAEQQREAIRQDYYSAFAAHNKPEIQPLISAVTAQVMREQNSNAWSKEIRDAVGARVNALLGTVQGGSTAQPTSPTPPPPPPLVTGRGRPAAPARMDSQSSLIDETFS